MSRTSNWPGTPKLPPGAPQANRPQAGAALPGPAPPRHQIAGWNVVSIPDRGGAVMTPDRVTRRRAASRPGDTGAVPYDPTIYLGSAAHYRAGRPAYSPGLEAVLVQQVGLDGNGRLLDAGCGPGVLTVRLAHLFALADRSAEGIFWDWPGDTEVVIARKPG